MSDRMPVQGDLDAAFAEATHVELCARVYEDRTRRLVPQRVVKAAGDLEELRHVLRIVEPDEEFHCACAGSDAARLWRGDEDLGFIIVHHGASIAWRERWRSQAGLVDGAALVSFFARHGLPGMRDEIEHHARLRRDEETFPDRFQAALPPGIDLDARGILGGRVRPADVARAIHAAHGADTAAFTRFMLGWYETAPDMGGGARNNLLSEIPLCALGQAPLDVVVATIVADPALHRAGLAFLHHRPNLTAVWGVPIDNARVPEAHLLFLVERREALITDKSERSFIKRSMATIRVQK